MKNLKTKTFALTILLLISFTLEAQFLVGGTISYTDSKNSNDDLESQNNNFNFSPELGVILKPMHVLGFRYSYTKYKTVDVNGLTDRTSNNYSIFSRHRKSLNKIFNVFGEAALTYSNANYLRNPNPSGIISSSYSDAYGISLGPGIEAKFAKKWLLITRWGLLSYYHTKTTVNSIVSKSNRFSASLNPASIGIGLNYLFDLKK